MTRILESPTMSRFVPSVPPSHKLDKMFLLAVLFEMIMHIKIVNKFDKPWLDREYGMALQAHLLKKQNRQKSVLEFKEGMDALFRTVPVSSSTLR